jgi:hypothetical protein
MIACRYTRLLGQPLAKVFAESSLIRPLTHDDTCTFYLSDCGAEFSRDDLLDLATSSSRLNHPFAAIVSGRNYPSNNNSNNNNSNNNSNSHNINNDKSNASSSPSPSSSSSSTFLSKSWQHRPPRDCHLADRLLGPDCAQEMKWIPNKALEAMPLACITLSRDPKKVFLQPAGLFSSEELSLAADAAAVPFCDLPSLPRGPVYFSINSEYERLLGVSPHDCRLRMEPFGWHALWHVASLDDAKRLSKAFFG